MIEYQKGTKPQIYALADFSLKNNVEKTAKSRNSELTKLANNEDFLTVNLDINGDGKEDKIVSSKPNTGDNLLIYFNENDDFVLQLKTTNFSQDGGNQATKIAGKNNGFIVETDFPQGTDRYRYFVDYSKGNFLLSKVIHEISSWQDNPGQLRVCEFYPQINLKQSSDEIFGKIISAEENAKCVNKKN